MDTQTLTRTHIEELLRDRIERAADEILLQNAGVLVKHGIVAADIKVMFSHIDFPPAPPTYPQAPVI